MSKEEMKLKIIDYIVYSENIKVINALCEWLVNGDYDYVPDLFDTKEDFEEFIEKWKPTKCCVKEEDND